MKIIGVTVGTSLPKPNFDQTDPKKGDYIKGDRSFLNAVKTINGITPNEQGDIAIDVDSTLTQSGIAADAKAVGDALETKQPIGDYVLKNEIPAVPVQSVNSKTGEIVLTASDVGALPNTTVIPSIEGLATETYVDNKVAGLVDSAPETLNTLNELSAALGDDPNFATTVATQIGKKAEKEHTHTFAELTDIGGASVNHATTADTANAVAWENVTGRPGTFDPVAHGHNISDVAELQSALDAKVPSNRTVNGKPLIDNVVLSASDIGIEVITEAEIDEIFMSTLDVDDAFFDEATGKHYTLYVSGGNLKMTEVS